MNANIVIKMSTILIVLGLTSISFAQNTQNNLALKNNKLFNISVPSNWASDYKQFKQDNTVLDVYRYSVKNEACSVTVIHVDETKSKSQDEINREAQKYFNAKMTKNIFRQYSKYKLLNEDSGQHKGIYYKNISAETQLKGKATVIYGKINYRFMSVPGFSYVLTCATNGSSQKIANKIFKENTGTYMSILNSFQTK